MSPQIALTLGILSVAVLLLVTERFRADLIGLLVLLGLALFGVVSPAEAVSGFSNPAVITIWAMLILSAGLARTGVANWLGRSLGKVGGKSEVTLLAALLFTVAGFSAFMSSTGIIVMMLPVISQIARKRNLPISSLLMPMAFGTLLGGTNTLISNAANLLASNALTELGLPAFSFFDFARVGVPVGIAGIAFMALLGRRLVPLRTSAAEMRQMGRQAGELYDLEERLFSVRLPESSPLAGRPLGASRLGTALKLNVIGITRDGRPRFAPTPDTLLRGGDELLVLGRVELLQQLVEGQMLTLEQSNGHETGENLALAVRDLVSPYVSLVEVEITPDSQLEEHSLSQMDFRKQYNANVLAIRRGERLIRTNFQNLPLQEGDRLLLQTSRKQLPQLAESTDFAVRDGDLAGYQLQDRLQLMSVPEGSLLAGRSLEESELAESFGLSVLGIVRKGKTKLMPRPRERLQAGDQLVVEGRAEDVELLHALQDLQISSTTPLRPDELETEDIGLAEMIISPHAGLKDKSLHDIHFREHYGLNVLAIWRRGRVYRSDLRKMPLHAGDSLLVHGDRGRIKLLAQSGEFLVTSPELQDAPRKEKAVLATLIMLGVVAGVGLGVLPIEIAAVAGAALMVVTRCINMEEAHRAIQWPAIFLIAGMLPLGIAMENTGAGAYLGGLLFAGAAQWSTPLLIAVLFAASNLAAQFLPTAVVVVLMASIALGSQGALAASPQAMLISIALGASLPFLTPLGHPAHLLVMGPGGYRFMDYFKVGLPLTLLTLAVVVVAVPYFWPG